MRIILLLSVILSFGVAVSVAAWPALAVESPSASLYFSPSKGTFFVGGTFDVSVFVNTEGSSINAVEVNIKFPTDLLQVVSPTAGSSFISIWTNQPYYSNKDGIVSFEGGVPSPGINTSAGLISTITFRAKAPGTALISFSDPSRVLLADGKGTNILKTVTRGEYVLVLSPPEGPKIFSTTHSSLTTWYKNNNPAFSWEKLPNIADFSWSLDQDPSGIPDNVAESSDNSASFSDIGDGTWYFHVKARVGNIWGGVSHYPIHIDITPPQAFKIRIESVSAFTGSRFFAYFSTEDRLSGVDYYEISVINMGDPQASANPLFIETVSPYRVPFEKMGKYAVLVRAYDKAGNYAEDRSIFTVINPFISYTESGIRVGDLFLPLWLIYVISAGVIIFIAWGLYRLFQRRSLGKILKKEIAEAEKEIEDVRKLEERIHKIRTLEEEARSESERLAGRLKGEDDHIEPKND